MLNSNTAGLRPLSSQEIILASQASWRSDILKQLGIIHSCCEHQYSEPRFESGSLDQFVESIAREKAKSLLLAYPEAIIIAADQLVTVDGEVLYKSGTAENAINQLQKLRGKTHQLICGVAVLFAGEIKSKIEKAELTMRSLSDAEIRFYVEQDKPWSCAGSYKIESLGASLFESIVVQDLSTIIGIPSNQLITLLREFGFSNLL